MRDESLKTIKERYGLDRSEIRCFIHYPPTYFHLHIHFVPTDRVLKVSCQVGRAVLIDDIIDNLTIDGEYYKKKTMTMEIKSGTRLHQVFIEN